MIESRVRDQIHGYPCLSVLFYVHDLSVHYLLFNKMVSIVIKMNMEEQKESTPCLVGVLL